MRESIYFYWSVSNKNRRPALDGGFVLYKFLPVSGVVQSEDDKEDRGRILLSESGITQSTHSPREMDTREARISASTELNFY